ncbi:TetR/AcrR family transcriptional regulator [Clavibacter tessellarius]|uniref:TetR family transcriptional regulator n=1 Tax=Clavibacter tessellarius TaxID=31965 RepID=A0A225CGL0_9MICO|nr:TetR/AcrR family transcriptional regulator [Clavibacter michiganensis]OQJ61546.1 TetR family transcriptional regulator [Clavibacter michiganensis subsp. tessellarius]UKF32753.1 TetR/AcrR family transcriptional regulator [Clavibacter michiganensis subsp. tessellarius]
MPDAPSDPPAPDPDPVAASSAAPPTGGTAGDSPATGSTASARDRILDAFEELLVQQGERGTTLESVAAAAGVSKGGLLYHFGGKEALVEGLLARMSALAREDVERLRQAERGPVDRWIRGSLSTATPFDRAYVATSRLAQGNHPRARDTLTHLQEEWAAVILEAVGDPAVARAVLLIGDGLYYNSALQPWLGGSAPADSALDELIRVVDDLVRLRSTRG